MTHMRHLKIDMKIQRFETVENNNKGKIIIRGDYNTGHFLNRVVLLRSNPRFCPIFRPSGVLGVIFAVSFPRLNFAC